MAAHVAVAAPVAAAPTSVVVAAAGVTALEELVTIIQAPAVLNGRTEPNIEILEEAGYQILDKRKFEMTEAQARSIAPSDENVRLYLGGPVIALLLRRENAYDSWEKVRRELDDTYSSPNTFIALRDKYAFFPTSRVLERMVIVVKPEHKQPDFNHVVDTLERNDFVILDRVARQLGGEMVEELFRERKGDADDMKYLRSDVSMVLVVEKIGAIDEWRLLSGPDDPRIAKLLAPDSLRAKIGGADRVHNGIYGSESSERALQDLKTVSSLFAQSFPLERTVAILKPDTFALLDAVRDEILANGFTILACEEMHMSQERAEQFYHAQRERSFFETLTRYLSSGGCYVLILAKPRAVDHWRKLIGPVDRSRASSLRARFGRDEIRNGFHASESAEIAREEVTFFFPLLPAEKDEKTTRRQQVEEFLTKKPAPSPFAQPKKSFNDVITEGLTQLCRVKPVGKDAILWLADWLLINNPNKPQVVHPEEVTVVSRNAAGTDDASIVWVLGGPGTNKNVLCQRIAVEHGYEVVSVAELVRAAVASSTPYGYVIKQCQSKGSAIPCHVVSSLLTGAMATSRAARIAKAAAPAKEEKADEKRAGAAVISPVGAKKKDAATSQARFIVTDFPYTLDQVFDFEQRSAAPTLVVYLDGPVDVLLKRAADEKETSSETKSSITRRIATFKEDVQPIVEHYTVFHKLRNVPVVASDDELRGRLTRAIKGQLAPL